MVGSDLIQDPDAFFERNANGIEITAPLAVVSTIAVFGILTAAAQTYYVRVAVEQVNGSAVALVGITTSVAGIFSPFLTWLMYTAVVFAIARLVGGTGTFRSTLKSIGVCLFPQVLGSLIGFAAAVLAIQAIVAGGAVESVAEFVAAFRAHRFNRLAQTLNYVFVVWSGFLWIFAVKHVHDLSLREAGISAGVPTLLTACYGIYTLL